MYTRMFALVCALLIGALSAAGCAAATFKPEVDSFPLELNLSGKKLIYTTPQGVRQLENTTAQFDWNAADGLLRLNGEQFRPRVPVESNAVLPNADTWPLFLQAPRLQELLIGALTRADSLQAFLDYVSERDALESGAERLYADRIAVYPNPDNQIEVDAQRAAVDEVLALLLASPLVESAYPYEQAGLILSVRVRFAGFTTEHSIAMTPASEYDEQPHHSEPPRRITEERAKLVVRNLVVKLRLQDVVDDTRGLSIEIPGASR